jgi:hypothetical protein
MESLARLEDVDVARAKGAGCRTTGGAIRLADARQFKAGLSPILFYRAGNRGGNLHEEA